MNSKIDLNLFLKKRFKGKVFNALVKVILNFYSCKANVEFTIACFDGIDVMGSFRIKSGIV